jgi:hypothetical protein
VNTSELAVEIVDASNHRGQQCAARMPQDASQRRHGGGDIVMPRPAK